MSKKEIPYKIYLTENEPAPRNGTTCAQICAPITAPFSIPATHEPVTLEELEPRLLHGARWAGAER